MRRDSRTGGARLERLRLERLRLGGPDGVGGPEDLAGPDGLGGAGGEDFGGAVDGSGAVGDAAGTWPGDGPRMRSPRGTGRGRHVGAAAPADDGTVSPVLLPAGRWRWTGVPVGAAFALLGAALVLVLLLGRGGAPDELVVGPAGPVATTPGADAASGADAAAGADVAPVEPLVPAFPMPAEALAAAPVATSPASVGAAVGPLVVHVDGAVADPGVVTVPGGSRVSDAVAAAGGVTAEADTRLVNLARLLQDGELVVVPRPGEAVAQPGTGGPPAATPPASGSGGAPPGPLDLNGAGVTELDALPGIGPVLAQRIVAHRDEQGPFGSVDDLAAVSGIGPAVLAGLRDLVTV